ncbi:MAG: VOC family protein, partial [Jatrophihabitans sp.]|uniref:VOC family protein n=1 Tax=Jatrophihabitans sp. TaxID=1932789 RepID=UPI003F7ED682
LVVEDVAAARRFYTEVFELPVHFEDDVSVVFRLGGTLVNLLQVDAAPELVEPAPVGGPHDGVRAVYTIEVGDVDAVCARLQQRGVDLLNGPIDRPWGVRTASFRAPGGHVWEVAGPVRST